LNCNDALGSRPRAALHAIALSHFLSQLRPRAYALFRTNRGGGMLRRLTSYLVRDARTHLDETAHAAEACVPPFGAGQDRPLTWVQAAVVAPPVLILGCLERCSCLVSSGGVTCPAFPDARQREYWLASRSETRPDFPGAAAVSRGLRG
jgi:hypothetical protein